MHMDNSRGTFEDVVPDSSPQMAELAHALRNLIQEVYPEVTEVPRPAEQHAGYGVGLNQRTEIFGYICPMPTYVRLGFYYGSALPDPRGLLQGTGKRLRHIKLYSLAEVERPEIRQLLEAAVRERIQAQGLQ